MTYYKVLNEDGSCYYGGRGSWSLPKNGWPGGRKVLRGKRALKPCVYGLHVLEEQDVLDWLGPALFELEIEGEYVRAGNKGLCRKARLLRKVEHWNPCTARLFAADCAERALLWERKAGREPAPASWHAVETARRYDRGEATRVELSAARHAARAARYVNAAAAAYASAHACASGDAAAARYAAAAVAARYAAAAASAALDAAPADAYAAERAWQSARLMAYLRGETPGPVEVP